LSARQLPKNRKLNEKECVDPYVRIDISGAPIDTVSHKTKHIMDNGFNPAWNAKFEFTIHCKEMAILAVYVCDSDGTFKDTKLGYYTAPVSCLRPGYRILHLRDPQALGMRSLPMCTLLCHFTITSS